MGNDLPTSSPAYPHGGGQPPTQSLLRVIGLRKRYVRGGLWRRRIPVAAVSQVDFEISRGQTLALVGASGSGKSTVARCVTRQEKPDSGQILIDGANIAQLPSRDLAPFRSGIQMVFQDPVTSMNPRFTALQIIEEPLILGQESQKGSNRQDRRDRVQGLMV